MTTGYISGELELLADRLDDLRTDAMFDDSFDSIPNGACAQHFISGLSYLQLAESAFRLAMYARQKEDA